MNTESDKWLALLIVFFFTSITSSLTAQSTENYSLSFTPTKGLNISSDDGANAFGVGFRMHQQIAYSQPVKTGAVSQSEALIRRARVLVRGHVMDAKLGYLLQLGFDKGNVSLMNAEYRWKPSKHTQIAFGQFLLPLGRQEQTVSKCFQLVDRSNVSRFFWLGWDIGINARRTFKVSEQFALKTTLALTHGEGRNKKTADGGWAWLGRLDLLPLGLFHGNGDFSESDLYREPTPKIAFGFGYYQNKDAYTLFGNDYWNGLEDDFNTIYVDGAFKYQGWSLMGEYVLRNVDNEIITISPNNTLYSNITSGEGFTMQGGKFVTETLEPTFRLSILNPNDASQSVRGAFLHQQKYEAGLNKFFLGHSLKIQGQIGYVTEKFAGKADQRYVETLIQFGISF